MQDDKELQQQPSATQGKEGFMSGMISCVFAYLSVIMFIGTFLSVHYVQSLQAVIYVGYQSPPWESSYLAIMNGIGRGESLALIFLLIGGVATLVAIVSGRLGVARARRSRNRRAMRVGVVGLVVGYVSIALVFVGCCLWLGVVFAGLT